MRKRLSRCEWSRSFCFPDLIAQGCHICSSSIHEVAALFLNNQVADLWGSLKLRQEALALAKLYGPTGPYASENKFPMLLCDTHFKLAKTYAALQCIPQATDHCNR